jgi:hypothetical protein
VPHAKGHTHMGQQQQLFCAWPVRTWRKKRVWSRKHKKRASRDGSSAGRCSSHSLRLGLKPSLSSSPPPLVGWWWGEASDVAIRRKGRAAHRVWGPASESLRLLPNQRRKPVMKNAVLKNSQLEDSGGNDTGSPPRLPRPAAVAPQLSRHEAL